MTKPVSVLSHLKLKMACAFKIDWTSSSFQRWSSLKASKIRGSNSPKITIPIEEKIITWIFSRHLRLEKKLTSKKKANVKIIFVENGKVFKLYLANILLIFGLVPVEMSR